MANARAIGSGTLAFGAVTLPIKVYTAAAAEGPRFNLLHTKCGGRMQQQMFCPTDKEVVDRKDMLRGFEAAKGSFVQFTAEEMDKLQPQHPGELELTAFVPEQTVGVVYLEKSYYLGPDKGGERGYKLLAEAMVRNRVVGVGTLHEKTREQLVVVRPHANGAGLLLQHAFYESEVRDFEDVDTGGRVVLSEHERKLADKLVEELKEPRFRADGKDGYAVRVHAAVDSKVAGKEISFANAAPRAPVVDLVEALEKSLAKGGPKKARKSVPPPARKAG